METKQRIIQNMLLENKLLASCASLTTLYQKLGLESYRSNRHNLTPSEGAIIAADIATKAAGVEIGFLDRFSGSLVITGDVASVEASLKQVINVLQQVLEFSPTSITRS